MTLQKQLKNIELPKIKLKWIRGAELSSAKVDFKKPLTHIYLGPKDAGKSSLQETCAAKYPKIIDLWGARDNEGLGWCRCKKFSKNEILFVHGISAELSSGYDAINFDNLKFKDLKRYRVIISVSAFYSNMNEEFEGLNSILYRVLYQRTNWKKPWFLMVREGANFLYSRIKIVKNQTIAKADFIYLLREARHMGYAIGVDTIKWTSIDLDIRHVSDYTWIKRVGIYGLPRDIRFIYRYINPPSLMDPKVECFVLLSSRGPIGIGRFEYPYWHKEEHENIVKKLGIKIEYHDLPKYTDARNTVSDFEHADIIRKRFQDGLSMNKIGKLIHRSPQTINQHIRNHNQAIEQKGFCPNCHRVKCELATNQV